MPEHSPIPLDYEANQKRPPRRVWRGVWVMYAAFSCAMFFISKYAIQHHKWYHEMIWINVAVLTTNFIVMSFWNPAQRSWLMRLSLLINILSVFVATIRLSRT